MVDVVLLYLGGYFSLCEPSHTVTSTPHMAQVLLLMWTIQLAQVAETS